MKGDDSHTLSNYTCTRMHAHTHTHSDITLYRPIEHTHSGLLGTPRSSTPPPLPRCVRHHLKRTEVGERDRRQSVKGAGVESGGGVGGGSLKVQRKETVGNL